MEKQGYVYILTNKRCTVLYVGVTSDLAGRMWQHREKVIAGFTKKYKVTRLVYFEIYEDMYEAIQREKQIKAGSRQDKINLINSMNHQWEDLYNEIV